MKRGIPDGWVMQGAGVFIYKSTGARVQNEGRGNYVAYRATGGKRAFGPYRAKALDWACEGVTGVIADNDKSLPVEQRLEKIFAMHGRGGDKNYFKGGK